MPGQHYSIKSRTLWAKDASPVLTLDQAGTGANLLQKHVTQPDARMEESDQASPAGLWRAIVDGDVYYIQRALAADWSSVENWVTLDKTNSLITLLYQLAFAENKGIILLALLSADEKWSGISEIGTMGYAATVGDLVYLAVADAKWELAKADVAATSKGKIGLVLATTAENSTCQVLLYGKMRSAAFPALTVGAPVHISAATAGDVVVAAPTGTTGFVVRIIGYGNTAEDLFFCPDNTYVELA